MNKRKACSPPHTIHKRKQSQRVINNLDDFDFIPSIVQSSHQEALLYVFEDNEAAIKMTIKGRSPTMRRVSRTHRVALDWLLVRINLDPKIQIKYIDTKNQLADILIKGNFTRDEWSHLLCLFNISHISSTECSEVMSKRTQKDSGEERVTAKSKPMMNLVARCSERAPAALSSIASESPVKTRHESKNLLSPQIEKYDRTERPVVNAQYTDRFIVENDKMNYYTVAESELSLESRSFLHRVNDQVRKRQNQSSKDTERQRQTFCDMGNVFVFYIASICIHAEELLRQLAFHQKYRRSHNETDVRHI